MNKIARIRGFTEDNQKLIEENRLLVIKNMDDIILLDNEHSRQVLRDYFTKLKMNTNFLLIRILAKASTVKALQYVSLHSMCRQDVENPQWGYFVMLDDTTYLPLSVIEFTALSTCFGEPTLHKFGTTTSSSLEHLQLLLDLETV